MKKLILISITTVIVSLVCIASALQAGGVEPVKKTVIIVKDKVTFNENTGSSITENRVADYVDEQTLKITTTLTTTPAVREQKYNRAVVQTELDHMPDRIASIQKDMDAALARKAELIKMLEVFK